jgi:arsenate reductase (thioredoxin)
LQDSYRLLAKSATVPIHLPVLSERFARERLRAAAWSEADESGDRPAVLFVCAHNSGRSQMAAGWLRAMLDDPVEVWSAGTDPSPEVNDVVTAEMTDVGVDLADSFPKPLTHEVVEGANVAVTLGCRDACPLVPGRRYEDRVLVHAMSDSLDAVQAVRDELHGRVSELATRFEPTAQ